MRKAALRLVASLIIGCSLSNGDATEIPEPKRKLERSNGACLSSFPIVEQEAFSILSYNICAGGEGFKVFDQHINFTEDKRHTWSVRSVFMKKFLETFGKTDLQAFQELGPQQVLDIQSYLGEKYNFIVLVSHPSDIEAGTIRNTGEHSDEIRSWGNKNVGTALISIAYNKNVFVAEETICFWLKEDPWTIPTDKNSRDSDKGFGNTNTSRAVLGIKFKEIKSQKKFYLFNSHYPIAGGAKARIGCATTEIREIKEITKGLPWIATGDRNFIGTSPENNEVYSVFFNNTMNVKDCRDVHHYGLGNSWIGFSTDPLKNPINREDGTFQNKDTRCVMFYSEGAKHIMKGLRSAHMLVEFDLKENRLLDLSDILKNLEQRTTVSDHAAIVFHFSLN